MKNGPYILVKAPENYPGKKYRDKYCYEHVLVWWQNTGDVPTENEQIHHKDENKHNNAFANLEKIEKGRHQKLHGEDRSQHVVKFKCPGCQDIFFRKRKDTFLAKGGQFIACSRECSGHVSAMKFHVGVDEFNRLIEGNIIEEFLGKIKEEVITFPGSSVGSSNSLLTNGS